MGIIGSALRVLVGRDTLNTLRRFVNPERYRLEQRAARKAAIRQWERPAGIMMYVHVGCVAAFTRKLADQGQHHPKEDRSWNPDELLGRYSDITHCDECGQRLDGGDEGYLSFWVVSIEDHRLWQEIEDEDQQARQVEQEGNDNQ